MTEAVTMRAMVRVEIPAGLLKTFPNKSTAAGTNRIETTAATTSNPNAYERVPPAASCFLGSIGGTGDTESTIMVILTAGGRSRAWTRRAAMNGMIISIVTVD